MPTDDMRQTLAAVYIADADEISVHDGDPGPTGTTNEISGGSPAYDRQPISWNNTADGEYESDQIDLDIPASTEVTHIGIWTSGGTFIDSAEASATFVSQGVWEVILTYTQA